MHRGLGHYVKRGLGGSNTAARRSGGTARTAGTLYGVLSGEPSVAVPGETLDRNVLAGQTVGQVISAIVEAVRPVDGTTDSERSRNAIRDSLSELLERFPNADLLLLSEDQRLYASEAYIALDVYNQFAFELGKVLQDEASSPRVALARLREVKNYIRETISSAFRAIANKSVRLTSNRVSAIARDALRNAFEVFESWVR
jgi:hypothetical protein